MKDPAVLFYISDWLTGTAGMDADCRAWYLDLLLHNYDKGSLPNDIEKLAVLAGVKYSEFKRFEQVFEHVLKHKFIQNDNGCLIHPKADKILKGREIFKEKRSDAGKLSYVLRYYREKEKSKMNTEFEKYIKENINLNELDIKNEQMLKQVFKQMFELYENENRNENINIDINKEDNSKIIPPKIEDVKNYCKERNNNVDPDKWFDFYTSKGWMVGKNKMKDWKAAVRTWEDKKNNRPQLEKFK